MRTSERNWGNPETGERFYGVRAFVPGYGWLDVAVGGKPAIFKTPEARDALRARLRREPPPERGADALVSVDELLGGGAR